VAAEAHLFGIVGAEFIAKELTVWRTPWLQLSIYDRQTFSAERAAGRCVGLIEAFAHLLSLTPDQKRNPPVIGCISESFTADSCQNDTHLIDNSRDSWRFAGASARTAHDVEIAGFSQRGPRPLYVADLIQLSRKQQILLPRFAELTSLKGISHVVNKFVPGE
jgi:hypothetical protein